MQTPDPAPCLLIAAKFQSGRTGLRYGRVRAICASGSRGANVGSPTQKAAINTEG